MRLKRIDTDESLLSFLSKHPDYRIYTIIGHEPMLSAADKEQIKAGHITTQQLITRQRIKDAEGDDYIDEFGLHVYITSRLGNSSDVDLRYDGETESELFTLQHVEK